MANRDRSTVNGFWGQKLLGVCGAMGLAMVLTGSLGFASDLPELRVVPKVELPKYLGRWYEIASFPQKFQKNCSHTTAEYSLKDNGDIRVVNRCRDTIDPKKDRTAEGKAWITDPNTNAKLRVMFFWPFSGAYWIVELGPDVGNQYSYAVVGHPDRDYLWVLSRTPRMEAAVLEGIKQRLIENGYELSPLQMTLQD